MEPLTMYAWIDHCKDQHLTIGDVKKLNVGDVLDVVIWDRNFEEYHIWNHIPSDVPMDPHTFFAKNRGTIIFKTHDPPTWDINLLNGGELFEHPVHVNTESLKTNWTWVPLEKDRCIHITKEILKTGETLEKDYPGYRPIHLCWDDFPEDTRVGWRGPIMLWKDLPTYPPVFWKSSYSSKE